jgi:hypothetical protein
MRRPGKGVAGFSSLTVDEDGSERWLSEPGLLTGAAGVGLALLAAVGKVEPRWDRVLLVSVPTIAGGIGPAAGSRSKSAMQEGLMTLESPVQEE